MGRPLRHQLQVAVLLLLAFRTFGRCAVFFSAKSSHLRKVSIRSMSATASVAAFSFRSCLSHLPKVCSFPAKSSHLSKVSIRAMSATASVAAFSFRSGLSHLRKVCSFSAKSSHLRKVRIRAMSATASVAAFSFRSALSHLPTGPAPDSHPEGAGSNSLSPSPSGFRYKPTCLGDLSRRPCPGNPSEKCRVKRPFAVTCPARESHPESAG